MNKLKISDISKNVAPLTHDAMGKLTGGFAVLGAAELTSDSDNDVCSENGTCSKNGTCKRNGSCQKQGRCYDNGSCGGAETGTGTLP